MAAHRGLPHSTRLKPRKPGGRWGDLDSRTAVGIVLVTAMLVTAVLVVVGFARAISQVKVEAKKDRPAEQRIPSVQRAVDSRTGLVFRLEGTQVAIVAKKGATGLSKLRGRSLLVQCGFLTDRGATIAQGRGRWASGGNELRTEISRRPGQFAQFCAVQGQSTEPAISRAVFQTPVAPPADKPR
jgi:hypothetical protein